jgi:hypothetical protein
VNEGELRDVRAAVDEVGRGLMMPSRAHLRIAVIVFASLGALAGNAFADDENIGTATSITTDVTGTLTSGAATLKTGDLVFQNETLITNATGIGQFEFRDKTKLAIGPGSTLVLDNFVYQSDTSKAKIVINLTAGALRFVTGRADHDAYEIVTPTATIGVRGTAFDVYTKDDGEMAVAMLEGAIEVCPKSGVCRLHDAIGKFLHMSAAGVFSLRDKWDGTFLAGIPFSVALPFLGDQKKLVPSLREKSSTVARYASTVGKDVGKMIRTPLTKLPKLKLPKLFGG